MIDGLTTQPLRTPLSADRAALHRQAEAMEAAFLAEMLGHAGVGDASGAFGGGIGEDQFASFLRQEQATALVKAGGIGLAESIFRALEGHADADR